MPILLRFVRVLVAQVVSLLITSTINVEIPYVNISLGALINAIAKLLRDKFKWEWLPL